MLGPSRYRTQRQDSRAQGLVPDEEEFDFGDEDFIGGGPPPVAAEKQKDQAAASPAAAA